MNCVGSTAAWKTRSPPHKLSRVQEGAPERQRGRGARVREEEGPGLPAEKATRVDVNLVLVNATVSDLKGRLVAGLERHQFRLWEELGSGTAKCEGHRNSRPQYRLVWIIRPSVGTRRRVTRGG